MSANGRICDLLLDMRHAGKLVAVVVDELGGTEGIATVEDIVEDLQDEYANHGPGEELFHKLDAPDYLASGRIELSQLAENLGIKLPAGNYSTIAGFILHQTGSIPTQGTQTEQGPVTLSVHRSTALAIQKVRSRWTD